MQNMKEENVKSEAGRYGFAILLIVCVALINWIENNPLTTIWIVCVIVYLVFLYRHIKNDSNSSIPPRSPF